MAPLAWNIQKVGYNLAKAGSFAKLYKVSPNDMRLKNIGKARKIWNPICSASGALWEEWLACSG